MTITLGNGVVFETSNGGSLQMLGIADLSEFGFEDGAAYYDDVRFNPYADMTLNVADDHTVTAAVQHTTGDPVVTFGLTSREPNGTTDVRVEGLKPEAWYRLEFDGVLAATDSGRAHDQASSDGVLEFSGVVVPNE